MACGSGSGSGGESQHTATNYPPLASSCQRLFWGLGFAAAETPLLPKTHTPGVISDLAHNVVLGTL